MTPEELEAHEWAQKHAHHVFGGYTEQQLKAIASAVAAAGLHVAAADLKERLSLLSWNELRLTVDDLDEWIGEATAIQDALRHLDQLLQPRVDEGCFSEGRWDCDPFGRLYRVALPPLSELSALANSEVDRLTRQRNALPKAHPNEKPVQSEKLMALAEIWIDLGGKVSYREEYRRYFEAAAKPIFDSKFAKANGLSWTSSTFSSHVTAWRKVRSRTGFDFER